MGTLPAAGQGLDFRATAGYVADPANCDFAGAFAYPHTTAQGATVGWESGPSGTRDRSTSQDARLAGIAYASGSSTTATFRVDLPAPGSYAINAAFGDVFANQNVTVAILDGATTVATPVNNQATSGSLYYWDAAGTPMTAANWPSANAPVALTFATTILRVRLGPQAINNSPIAHLFVQAAGGTTITLAQAAAHWSPVPLATNATVQIALTQASLRWFPRMLAANSKTQATISRQPWGWAAAPIAANQKTQATIAQRTARWAPAPLGTNQRTQTVLAQAAWRWAVRALEITQPMLLTLTRTAWLWRGRKLPGYGNAALSQIQGFVVGLVRKFVSGFDETPPE